MIKVRILEEHRKETLQSLQDWSGQDENKCHVYAIHGKNKIDLLTAPIEEWFLAEKLHIQASRSDGTYTLSQFTQGAEIRIQPNSGGSFTLWIEEFPFILLINERSQLQEIPTELPNLFSLGVHNLFGFERFTNLKNLIINKAII
ncbi:MAG: hypothetical protein H7A23_12870 [Leptospiraceae bacterium]|nr:hypothetical protein [Leptospiraceae bacterium]